MGFPEQTWIIGSGSSLHTTPHSTRNPAGSAGQGEEGSDLLRAARKPKIGLGCRKLTWRSNEASRSGA